MISFNYDDLKITNSSNIISKLVTCIHKNKSITQKKLGWQCLTFIKHIFCAKNV